MNNPRNDRAEIFARLKQANASRAKTPHPGAIAPPKRGSLRGKSRLDQFIQAATAQYATIAEVPRFVDIPASVTGWLKGQNLPRDLVVAPILSTYDWGDGNEIRTRIGAATTSDMVGISLALSAVAETGTVMMIASEHTPTTLNFVPDVDIIVISKKDVEAGLEGCWEKLRDWKKNNPMPRAVNFITGPSRTADVEATMVLGAHGPRRLHLILVDEKSPWPKSA